MRVKTRLKSWFILLVSSLGLLLLTTNCGDDDDVLSLTETYTSDDIFSFDYVHPSEKGQAYLANLVIDGLNTKYSAGLAKRKYSGAYFLCKFLTLLQNLFIAI